MATLLVTGLKPAKYSRAWARIYAELARVLPELPDGSTVVMGDDCGAGLYAWDACRGPAPRRLRVRRYYASGVLWLLDIEGRPRWQRWLPRYDRVAPGDSERAMVAWVASQVNARCLSLLGDCDAARLAAASGIRTTLTPEEALPAPAPKSTA